MKERKGNKQGISLIVLVITIIVMIILAAAVILSLSSNGIIDRANEAVKDTDLAQVQTLASTIWAEIYLENMEKAEKDKLDYETEVISRLQAQKIDTSKYDIDATDKGVIVKIKEEEIQHSGVIPAGGTYYVGVTSTAPGDYTGATAVYRGAYKVEDSKGMDTELVFGMPYSATMADGSSLTLIFHTDGSGEAYQNETLQSSMPKSTFTYTKTNVMMGEDVLGNICSNGSQLDATASEGCIFTLDTSATVGNYFPETVSDGDIYVYGDYEYRYNYACINGVFWQSYAGVSGWSVRVLDDTQVTYGEIIETINGKDVTSMAYTFYACYELKTAPSIPSKAKYLIDTFTGCEKLATYKGSKNNEGDFSGYIIPNEVSVMFYTFSSCDSLIVSPVIPENIIEIAGIFNDCTALTSAPDLSKCKNLINMSRSFWGCKSLKTYVGSTESEGDFSRYIIPENVSNMNYTFYNCAFLTGSITINATPAEYDECLKGTQITEILGSCENKDEILATK